MIIIKVFFFQKIHSTLPASFLMTEDDFQQFVETNIDDVQLDDALMDFLGLEMFWRAFNLQHTKLRPLRTNETTPALRRFIPNPIWKNQIAEIIGLARELRSVVQEAGSFNVHSEEAFDKCVESLEAFYFMESPPTKQIKRVPRMGNVSSALKFLENDFSLFADVFCGWSPEMVSEFANEVATRIAGFDKAEERVLVILARFKQTASSWSLLAFLFQRSSGYLCKLFSQSVKFLLDESDWLISLDRFRSY